MLWSALDSEINQVYWKYVKKEGHKRIYFKHALLFQYANLLKTLVFLNG